MAMFLEEAGIPTVPINTHVFARLARATASAYGMPTMRNVYVPQPVVGRTPDELRAYIEGDDPVSKRPFMQEVVEALTKPLAEEDFKNLSFDRSTPRLLPADTPDNLREMFIRNRWTDMLPIVLPTEERVAAMLAGARKPIIAYGRGSRRQTDWDARVALAERRSTLGITPETSRTLSGFHTHETRRPPPSGAIPSGLGQTSFRTTQGRPKSGRPWAGEWDSFRVRAR